MTNRFFGIALVLLGAAASTSVVWAGPNAGGTLVVHDVGLNATCEWLPGDPASCEQIDNELPAGPHPECPHYFWKVYAAFPPASSPRLKAMVMGAAFGADIFVFVGGLPDPAMDFEIPDAGWPTESGRGVGISYGIPKTAELNYCYWFAGYGYSGIWNLTPHPLHGAVFVDDSVPPLEDPIAALGSIGFGQPGETPCPVSPPLLGACCHGIGECTLTSEEGCLVLCGTWLGPDVPCSPNPCPNTPTGACCFADGHCETLYLIDCMDGGGDFFGGCCEPNPCSVPIERTTWGRLKRNYW